MHPSPFLRDHSENPMTKTSVVVMIANTVPFCNAIPSTHQTGPGSGKTGLCQHPHPIQAALGARRTGSLGPQRSDANPVR